MAKAHSASKSSTMPKLCRTPSVNSVLKIKPGASPFTLPNTIRLSGSSSPAAPPSTVPVFSTNWFVEKSALSRKTSWYSCERFRGRAGSLARLKWRVLRPVVEGSVPVLEAGMSSARRKPVCVFSGEGAKMEASEIVRAMGVVSASNWGC